MKTKLSFILALVMLVGSIFSVLSFAEGETAIEPEVSSYTDVAIAYADVNYTDKIYMKFAVPVYADLPEGAKIELVVWDGNDIDGSFGYSDAVATDLAAALAAAISPEEAFASIGGVDHLVFIYDAITIEMLTDVIYVRPVVILADGSNLYGDVITYSVLEYIQSAKGAFEDIAALEDADHLALLDSMLDFGAMAQSYADGGDGYLPCGFLANEQVNKVWVNTVYDGVAGERVFGGFFKPGAEYASVFAPVADLYDVVKIVDADGVELEDQTADYAGLQTDAPEEGDLEVTVHFAKKTIFDSTIENAELGWYSDNKGTNIFTQAKAGMRVEMVDAKLAGNSGSGPLQGKRNFSSFVVIDDPINPESGEKVLRWAGMQNSALYFNSTNSPIAIRNAVSGFGDILAPVITLELVIAGHGNNPVTTANFRIRSDYKNEEGTSKQCNLNIMKIEKDVVKIGVAEGVYQNLCTLSRDSYTKIAITIDFANETIKAYCANEGEEYTKVVDSSLGDPSALKAAYDLGYESYASLLDWFYGAQSKIEWYGGNVGGGITEAELRAIKADMDGDGVGETPISNDGTLENINTAAYAKWFEDNRSMLVKDAKMFVGGVE